MIGWLFSILVKCLSYHIPNTNTSQLLALEASKGLMVSSKVVGRHLSDAQFSDPLARQWTVRALAALHTRPITEEMMGRRGELRFPWSVTRWLPFVRSLKLIPERTKNRLELIEKALVSALNNQPAIRTPIHGDPQPGNILVDSVNKRATLIDFEYGAKGDPMFDLAFFCTSVGVTTDDAMFLLKDYQAAVGPRSHASDEPRLLLYLAYQSLFRHVASHKEYTPKKHQGYNKWLARVHTEIAHVEARGLLRKDV